MLDRFGTMALAEVLEPAIEYAQGHPIQPNVASTIEGQRELFSRYPTTARVFFPGSEAPEPWEMFPQPDLARTFQRLAAAEQEALAQGKSRSEALQAAFALFYKGDRPPSMRSMAASSLTKTSQSTSRSGRSRSTSTIGATTSTPVHPHPVEAWRWRCSWR